MPIPYNLKTTNAEVPPSLTAYLEEKLASLEHFFNANDPSLLCSVELGKTTEHHHTGRVYRAEINLHVSGKKFRATAIEESLEAAIDSVKEELKKELRRAKDREKSLLHRGGAKLKQFLRFGKDTS